MTTINRATPWTFVQEVQSLAMALQLIAKDPGPDAEQAKAELQQQGKRKFDSDTRKYAASITHDRPRPKAHEPTQEEIDRFVAEKSQAKRLSEWKNKARNVFSRFWLRLSADSKSNAQDIIAALHSHLAKGALFDFSVTAQKLNSLTLEEESPPATRKTEPVVVPDAMGTPRVLLTLEELTAKWPEVMRKGAVTRRVLIELRAQSTDLLSANELAGGKGKNTKPNTKTPRAAGGVREGVTKALNILKAAGLAEKVGTGKKAAWKYGKTGWN